VSKLHYQCDQYRECAYAYSDPDDSVRQGKHSFYTIGKRSGRRYWGSAVAGKSAGFLPLVIITRKLRYEPACIE
jgi:hypothetical protein